MPGEAIHVRRESGVTIVSLSGEHDLSTAPDLRDALESASPAVGGLVVDLSHAEFIDSSFLGLIVSASREADSAGTCFGLVVCNGSGASVRRVLELTDLASALPIHPDLASALAACADSAAAG